MCQEVPRQVLAVVPGRFRVDWDGAPRWVAASTDAAIGDYVVVYAGVALERLDPEEAREQLRFMRDLQRMLEEDAS